MARTACGACQRLEGDTAKVTLSYAGVYPEPRLTIHCGCLGRLNARYNLGEVSEGGVGAGEDLEGRGGRDMWPRPQLPWSPHHSPWLPGQSAAPLRNPLWSQPAEVLSPLELGQGRA